MKKFDFPRICLQLRHPRIHIFLLDKYNQGNTLAPSISPQCRDARPLLGRAGYTGISEMWEMKEKTWSLRLSHFKSLPELRQKLSSFGIVCTCNKWP